jgi:large subunit ribosomal protein L22
MSVTAKIRYLRIAPRKVRLVADLIRGKSVEEAQTILSFTTKKATLPLSKLLNQAVANARNNFQLDPANLFISKITVDEGPKYKRWMARARGQASEIQKKTSHITLILDEIVKKPKKVKKVKPKVMKEEKKEEGVEEKIVKPEKPPKEKKSPTGQAKLRPEKELLKPKREGVFKRVFRRKAF